MYQDKKIAVIIAAAGTGKRMEANVPKQYLCIGDIPILAMTIRAFDENPYIDEVLVTVSAGEKTKCEKEILEKYEFKKSPRLIIGGKERQDSVYAALKEVSGDISYVLVHDGARPFVKEEDISAVVEMTVEKGAAVLAVPVKDTVKVVCDDIITDSPKRDMLFAAQTPQGFAYETLMRAFEKAYSESYYGTDEAVLLARLDEKVYIVNGDYDNIKITTPSDLNIGRAVMSETMKSIRSGIGYDVHKFSKDRKLILGGIEIPFEKGLLGHSDADVLTHAIMDALLGAAALGDIGRHFPDNDDQYRGVMSLILLGKVGMMLADSGYSVSNIDATVIAEKPKIARYIPSMISAIAGVLQINESQINIKGTTTEKLGFTGRGEGIAAEAIATIISR